MRITSSRAVAAATAALLAVTASACSKSGGSSNNSAPASTATVDASCAATPSPLPSSTGDALQGSVAFNDANLTALDNALGCALKGKDLSSVNIAMVVNVAADYWKAGQTGFQAGCKALNISSSNCNFFAPPDGTLTEQDTELESLRGKGVTGYSISAIDPASAKNAIATDVAAGRFVLAIDSPLPGTDAAGLYLGTPNTEAGYNAGLAMKAALGSGGGDVAILVGSLTAANATERIAGFKQALAGSNIQVTVTQNDNLSASTAQSEAETILANNPNVKGLYGVYSYDGPALAKAVSTSKKTGIKIVCDDSDPATLSAVQSGAISATIVQMPYYQGYTGAYILAAMKVLGKDATMKLIQPFLESDGSTLSSGVGVVTQADYSAYTSLEQQLGIG